MWKDCVVNLSGLAWISDPVLKLNGLGLSFLGVSNLHEFAVYKFEVVLLIKFST